MRNTGKRIITTSLAAVMIITALLGNGIEARAADYSIKNSLLDYEFKVGDVIIPDENSPYCFLNFYDVNDPGIIITIGIDVTERYTIRESYSDGKNTVRTNAKWKCVKQGPTFLTLKGEPYIPQTEEKKPESTPPKEVTNQPDVEDQPEIAEEVHLCNMEWVTTKEPSVGEDGEECYRCSFCGRTEQKMPIPGAVAYVKDLYGYIKDAAENGLVTYDAKTNTAISDYIIQKMAERRDVTTVISFEYKGEKYQITFSPEADYDALLNDEEQFYGYLGLSGYEGITVEKVDLQS
mgnify:FL=1